MLVPAIHQALFQLGIHVTKPGFSPRGLAFEMDMGRRDETDTSGKERQEIKIRLQIVLIARKEIDKEL